MSSFGGEIGSAYVKVRPDLAGFEGALATNVSASSRRAGTLAGKEAGLGFSQGFKSALKTGAALVAVTSVFEGIKTSVAAAAEHTGEIQLLDRAISNAGASNQLYGDSVEDVIRKEALQKGFIDEELYPAFSRLVQVTHSSRKAYADLGLAEDVARQRHIGVSVAALALAKAEQGSVTSLQRLGIILPKHVRDLTGAAKATAALEVVQKRFGGSSAAFAASEAGSLDRFAEARHVIEESVGGALAPDIAHVADVTANWTSKSENLARVQHDVAATGHVVAGVAHDIGIGIEVASKVTGPFVAALGGVEKTAELAFGAFALSKVVKYGRAVVAWATATTGAEAEKATATGIYTAALEANTAALVANTGAQALNLRGFNTVATAAARSETNIVAASNATSSLKTNLIGLGAITIAPIVVPIIAKYEGKAHDLANKVGGSAGKFAFDIAGLLVGGATAGSLANDIFGSGKKIPEPTPQGTRDNNGFSTANLVPSSAQAAAAKRPTDLDYKIQLQEALATKATADEEALYKTRLAYVTKRVNALKADTNLTADQKKNLLRLETEQASLQSAITGIDNDAAQAAKDAADKARQAYSSLVSAHDQSLQLAAQRAQLTQKTATDDLAAARAQLAFDRAEARDAKLNAEQRAQYASQAVAAEGQIQSINQQIHDKELQSFKDQQSLKEQRLQLAAQRAQLTQGSIADDKRAAQALIAYYTSAAKDAKHYTEAERLQFRSQAINERIALKGLTGQSQGATAQQIFGEAASEFATYGSNIAGRSGVLSGQDARASLGHRLLGGGNPGADIAIRVAMQQRSAQLSEAQRQTALLTSINRSLAGTGPANRPSADAIRRARRTAQVVGG